MTRGPAPPGNKGQTHFFHDTREQFSNCKPLWYHNEVDFWPFGCEVYLITYLCEISACICASLCPKPCFWGQSWPLKSISSFFGPSLSETTLRRGSTDGQQQKKKYLQSRLLLVRQPARALVLTTLTCGDSSKSLARLPWVETATASKQRANPAVQHAVPFSFHLAARVSITHTWEQHDN